MFQPATLRDDQKAIDVPSHSWLRDAASMRAAGALLDLGDDALGAKNLDEGWDRPRVKVATHGLCERK